MRHWLKQSLIALDQLLNALTGGWADETLSSRIFRKRNANRFWRGAWICLDLVAFMLGDAGHCESAWQSEVKRLQCPPVLRE